MSKSPARPPGERATSAKPPPHWLARGLALTADPPTALLGLAEEIIAFRHLVLTGELPARVLTVEMPPKLMRFVGDPTKENGVRLLALLATKPSPDNPFNDVANAAQRKLQRARAAQLRAHQLARNRVPSPQEAHDMIQTAIAEIGNRRGAITATAQHYRISPRQVYELEKIWQHSTKLIVHWQAVIDSLKLGTSKSHNARSDFAP